MTERRNTRWPLHRRAAAVLAGVGAALGLAYWLLLPDQLFHAPLSYVVEARDGTLLSARIAADGQWRFPPGRDVPAKFRRALIVFEDKRFAAHSGIDGLAIARAAKLNLAEGRVVSGGSTLTMQLARLSRTAAEGTAEERTLRAKLAEGLLALRLETAYDKQQLLSLYAANAPFGGNVVGLEAASWRYFGREPAHLSWAEAATLAVLPNNPALVHLKRNRARLQARRDFVLRRLREAGDLSALDLDLALAEPLTTEPHDLPDLAPHLLDTLRAEQPTIHRVRTTLDARLQMQATQLVNEHSEMLARQNVHNAAALIVDNVTFEVLAYVGNSNGDGHAVDIIRRPRSTGSILKPMLYAAMLEDGLLTPRMLLPDVPTHYEGFSPENFDREYRGAVRADEALAQSLNIPAVRELKAYGVARFADLLRASGMSTLKRPADDYGLTLILGGAEGNLWDITGLYASLAGIARAGLADREPQFHVLTSILGTQSRARGPTPISTGAAWLTLRALLEVPRPGEEGHWRSFADSRAIAWKTGTSWGLRDGWAVGSTSRYTIGVWVGNARGEGRPGLTGSNMAAPLMFGLFNTLPASPWFEQPVHALRQVQVCVNDGFLAVEGCETERVLLPKDSHFEMLSPHNPRVNLEASGRFRVDSECESPGEMRHTSWFVLPAAEEFYYRRGHAEYRPLPSLRADCVSRGDARGSLALLYPDVNGRVLIPGELDGTRGRAVFEAVHRRRDATIYWHLDDRYLGATHTFHQQSLDMDPGPHILTLVDNEGQRVTRRFEVLATHH
ncbi:MAG TPA: penicillin-binding protein 1C [Steroidobacteraceae bacterium]|nr:penicillin-binding protein 1C [Steroidobacteraceae bacterium]